jgi:hypothetical protein
VARFDQIRGHAGAHASQSDESEFHDLTSAPVSERIFRSASPLDKERRPPGLPGNHELQPLVRCRSL